MKKVWILLVLRTCLSTYWVD